MYAYVHALIATTAVCDRSHTCPLQHAFFTLTLGSTTDSRLPTQTATRTRTRNSGTTIKHRHIRNSVPYRHTNEQGNKNCCCLFSFMSNTTTSGRNLFSLKTLAESITVGRCVVQTFLSKLVRQRHRVWTTLRELHMSLQTRIMQIFSVSFQCPVTFRGQILQQSTHQAAFRKGTNTGTK